MQEYSPFIRTKRAKPADSRRQALIKDGQVASPHQEVEMEAGGIEPPSRDISTMPSTCVVANLSSRQRCPLATGYAVDQPRTLFSFPRARHDGQRSGIATGFWALPASPRSQGCLTRQPKRRYLLQILFGQLLTWPTDQPRHATSVSSYPVESNSPPLAVNILCLHFAP